MKIVSIIRRAGGSTINVGGTDYKFVPDDNGEHVCDVADEKHAERFLSIREGYRCAAPDSKPAATAKTETEVIKAVDKTAVTKGKGKPKADQAATKPADDALPLPPVEPPAEGAAADPVAEAKSEDKA